MFFQINKIMYSFAKGPKYTYTLSIDITTCEVKTFNVFYKDSL